MLEDDEVVIVFDDFSYGSSSWQRFNSKAQFDRRWLDELYKVQLQNGLPELWFFRQLFLTANAQQRALLQANYTTYHDWFHFEQVAQLDAAAITAIDSLTRDRLVLKKPILWSMRSIYFHMLKTNEQRDQFKAYDPVFYRWLEFERSIAPITQDQYSKIDVLGFKLEVDGNYKDFVAGLIRDEVFTAGQWEAYKAAYPEVFAKPAAQKKSPKPRASAVQSSNDFLKFFCGNPEDETTLPANNGRKKRVQMDEVVQEKGQAEFAEPSVMKQLKRSSDATAKLLKVPGLTSNGRVIEWKLVAETSVQCIFNSKDERDAVYQEITELAKYMNHGSANKFLNHRGGVDSLVANKEWLERLYGNFILVETLQEHSKELTAHLILLFSSIATESEKTTHTWNFMQFLSVSREKKYIMLRDPKHQAFCIMLNNYSYRITQALCSQDTSLTNLITHFTSFNDAEKEFVETHIDRLIYDCSGGIKDSINEFLTNLIALAQTALLENQSFASMLYVRYLYATEPEYKMQYLEAFDARCINKEFLLKGFDAYRGNGYY